ncbi:MAG: exopolysaccharide biosynthesis polyprenyl glycosylphosphotransferase [Akkermansia sp.]|nr:exopolysaccharide biosynthesis polyprenyl glycosylphosphotransferase [Akkermansia sp.]
MIRQSQNLLSRVTPVLDFALAFVFAYYSANITNRLAPLFGWERELAFNLLTSTPFLAGVALVSIPFVLQCVGFYRKNNLQSISSAIRQLIGFAAYYFAAWAIYQSTRNNAPHFNHVILVNAVGIPLVIFCRFLLTRFWRLHTRVGLRQVILAGTEEDIARQWDKLPAYWRNRCNVVGRAITGQMTERELQDIIETNSVSHLVVCGGLGSYSANEATIQQCEMQGIDIYLMLQSESHPGTMSASINDIQDSRMLILSSVPTRFWPRLVKEIMDRIVAVIILICSLPVWIIAAIGIKISDPKGPIFYKQMRSGLYGKPFGIWKFRSMYVDADKRLDEIKAKYGNEMSGPIFKLTNDPRIFRFGHIIRKLSIDELPQLLNIIKGDMSIVGPRPLPVYETAEFPSIAHRRRLSVKPGLTCYWQIEDRSNNGDFDNLIRKDLKYIDNWSLWLDVVLFFRTIPAVLFGRGAK